MSSPRLTYVKQNGNSVELSYANLPTGSRILLVNNTSGSQPQDTATNVADGGDGTIDIAAKAPAGQYHFIAQDGAQNLLAETVAFYLS